jgi:hypothetical protein
MNELDKLLRQFEGADYYSEEPENHGRWPLWLYAFVIAGMIGAGFCIAKAIQALA